MECGAISLIFLLLCVVGKDIKHPTRGHVVAQEDDHKIAYVQLVSNVTVFLTQAGGFVIMMHRRIYNYGDACSAAWSICIEKKKRLTLNFTHSYSFMPARVVSIIDFCHFTLLSVCKHRLSFSN